MILAGVVLGALVVGYSLYAATAASNQQSSGGAPGTGVLTTSVLVGHQAPSFNLPELADAAVRVSLRSFAGKPLVINFFSPACIPCRQEMPAFARLAGQYQGKVSFVGIDEMAAAGDALSLVKSDHVPYASLIDASGALVGPYLLPGIPVTVFVSSSDMVRGYVAGAISAQTLSSRVNALAAG